MSEMYSTIGTQTYTNLLADPEGADVISVPVEPGSGDVACGTVLYRKSSGLWAPAATANVVVTNQLVVLGEAVAAGSAPAAGAVAVAEDAKAYRAGTFVDGAVKLAAGAALTDAHKVVLRQQGIVFDKKESTADFTNSVTGA